MNNLNEYLWENPAPAPGALEQIEHKNNCFVLTSKDILICTLTALLIMIALA